MMHAIADYDSFVVGCLCGVAGTLLLVFLVAKFSERSRTTVTIESERPIGSDGDTSVDMDIGSDDYDVPLP